MFAFPTFRSTDYGTTYTKLNLMPGTTIVVTSFYICPTNKKKVSGYTNDGFYRELLLWRAVKKKRVSRRSK